MNKCGSTAAFLLSLLMRENVEYDGVMNKILCEWVVWTCGFTFEVWCNKLVLVASQLSRVPWICVGSSYPSLPPPLFFFFTLPTRKGMGIKLVVLGEVMLEVSWLSSTFMLLDTGCFNVNNL